MNGYVRLWELTGTSHYVRARRWYQATLEYAFLLVFYVDFRSRRKHDKQKRREVSDHPLPLDVKRLKYPPRCGGVWPGGVVVRALNLRLQRSRPAGSIPGRSAFR